MRGKVMNKWLKNMLTSETGKQLIEKAPLLSANALNVVKRWLIPLGISAGSACALIVSLLKKKQNEKPQVQIPVQVQSGNMTMSELVQLEQLVSDLSTVSSSTLTDVVNVADDHNFDRNETLALYIKIMGGLLNQLDLEEYDPEDSSHLS